MVNSRIVKAVIGKDMRAITASPQTWLPMVVVPLIFVVLIPILLIVFLPAAGLEPGGNEGKMIEDFMNGLPAGELKSTLDGFGGLDQKLVFLILNYFFVPMFLIIPVMVSSIIAASSFAGEKERKTLETLLFSPASELDLFLGKILAALLPSLVVSLLGFLVYGVVIDTLGLSLFGRPVFPTLNWLFVMIWLIPAVSLLAVFVNVYVSARVKGFQEAQQLSALLVLPLLLLVFGQIGGVVFLDIPAVLGIGAGVLALDALLIRLAAKTFTRERLFITQIK